MSYTQKLFDPVEGDFPAPPEFLTWVARDGSKGQIRNQHTLAKAKRYVGHYIPDNSADAEFMTSWRIYQWDWEKGKYALLYQGEKGDLKKSHPLWRKSLDSRFPVREVSDDDMAEVLASLGASLGASI